MSEFGNWDRLANAARGTLESTPAQAPPGFTFAVVSRAAAARRDNDSDVLRLIFRTAIVASIVAAVVGVANWRAIAGELAPASPDQFVTVNVEPGL